MRLAFLLAAGLLGTASPTRAAVLLTVDITNPSAVTFTANPSGLALVSAGNSIQPDLQDFLTSNASASLGQFVTGGTPLGPAQGTQRYNFFIIDRGSSALYLAGPGNQPTAFVAGQQAFTGQATVDLSFAAGLFRTQNFVGDIRLFGSNTVDQGVVLGQYQLIAPTPVVATPAPATAVVFAAGLAAVAARRRRTG